LLLLARIDERSGKMKEILFLRKLPLFEQLSEEEIAEIASLLVVKEYDKGSNLFWEKEEGNELYIIQSGAVKIYRQEEGREIILTVFHAHDYFGEMALFGDQSVRSASASTLDKTKVFILRRVHFLELLQKKPDIFIKILNTTLERLRKANELIADLAFNSANSRVARLLFRLSEEQTGQYVIPLKLTHHQIADMTATTRETVTKILSDMQNKGIIQIVRKQITITDPEELKACASLE